jgi:hypothetical protein
MPFLFAAGAILAAGDVPVDIAARFVKIVSSSHVACKDAAMATALGPAVDPASKFAWGASESEVKALKAAGKCVITSKVEWLASGGSIAIVEEGGKPQMYIHSGNVAASGVTLPDAVLKVSKRQ